MCALLSWGGKKCEEFGSDDECDHELRETEQLWVENIKLFQLAAACSNRGQGADPAIRRHHSVKDCTFC